MKRFFAFLLMLILLVPGLAAAETKTRQNEESGYIAVIEDGAGLLDTAEYDGVFSTMMPITSSIIAELTIVVPTVPLSLPNSLRAATVMLTEVADIIVPMKRAL